MFSRRRGIVSMIILAFLLIGYKSAGAEAKKLGSISGISFTVEFEKFEYCKSVDYDEDVLLAPLVDKKKARQYKKRVKALIADIGAIYGHTMNQREGDMMLRVTFNVQLDSGVWYDDGKMEAFKEYYLKLSLVSKDGKIILRKKYKGIAEEIQMNIHFSYEELERCLRENFNDFFSRVKYAVPLSSSPEVEIEVEDEKDIDETVEEILKKVGTRDNIFEEEDDDDISAEEMDRVK